LRLEESIRMAAAGYVFAGDGFPAIVAGIAAKRLVLMMVQAFFCIRMAGVPISVLCGMLVQMSISLPWQCMINSELQGVFIVLLMLPLSLVYLLAGSYAMGSCLKHFERMCREIRIRKSAEDTLREGIRPIRGMLLADAAMLICVPIEVFFYMNIV